MPSQPSSSPSYEVAPIAALPRAENEDPNAHRPDPNADRPADRPDPIRSEIIELRPAVRVQVDLAYADARKHAIHEFERIYVAALLVRSHGNVSQAARDAGIDRVYLHRLIRRHRTRG